MPVQVFTSSPIHASHADGTSPQTADGRQSDDGSQNVNPTPTSPHGHPAQAQAGATPFLPAQTAAAQTRYRPTHTQPVSPPQPQPGAAAYTTRAYGRRGWRAAEEEGRRDYSHPPGYQQNVHAAEFSSAQRAANEGPLYAGEESVWETARRWAAAAGEGLAAAEHEIWKRINGG